MAKAKPAKADTASHGSDDQKMLDNALGQIEKAFGRGSIMKLSEAGSMTVSGIPTGALSIDLALGGMGFPRGRIIEVYGPESSGKTTLALHAVASAQREGGIAAFIDAEHALDPLWAKRLGVNLEDLLVSQPSSGEEALQIAEMLIKSNAVDVIVIDSVAALVPRAELDGEIGDSHVGLQARMMSQAMRKLTGAIAKAKTCVIFINQIREKIGVMFGSPETTPGGRALKFYSSCRVDVRRISQLKEGDNIIGMRMKIKIVKNKVAPPFRQTEVDLLGARGISLEGDLIDLALAYGLITRAGTWMSYGDIKLGQGRDKARALLEERPELVTELREKIMAAYVASGQTMPKLSD
ncbi:MAG: recombinase RecA [Planctomycetes bacterium]|nr:recombinase RecA [Planctomycetota bacterium]